MLLRPILAATSLVSAARAAAVPDQLFDAHVYSKLSATAALSAPSAWPEYTTSSGAWATFSSSDWTVAFLPSTFYALNHRHPVLCPATIPSSSNGSDVDWLAFARIWSAPIFNPWLALEEAWVHDVGFSSWVASAELALGANETAQTTLLQEAEYLASRFSGVVGCTRSWDRGDADFEVIIDNMMNLQLLVHAAEISGNTTYLDMAKSHANKTLAHQIRDDGSSFHVVDYSPTTGEVQWSGTAQGYSNSSTWSRGQAWGINGFALMYNATKDPVYLDTSRRMASYFLDHLPGLGVSYWDFDALPSTLDTSASLITSSALLLLSSLESSLSNSSGAQLWSDAAITLLSNVVEQGVAGWEGASLVGDGTVNNRADPPNNNTGIIYGDYYFIESGNQLLSLGLANCTDGSPAVGSSLTASLSSTSPGSATSSSRVSSPSSSTAHSSGASQLRPPALARWLSKACRSWTLL